MSLDGSLLALLVAMFLGGFVSGISGFAFSAVAGAILLQVYAPSFAVPLMMACALVAQLYGLFSLRDSMEWRRALPLIIGGCAGIPLGLYVLKSVDPHTFRLGFGIFLTVYAAYMLFRPATLTARRQDGRAAVAAIGFAGGLVGGLSAFPGALPTIWCDLRGFSKDVKRGMTQPYIALMQFFGILLVFLHGDLSREFASKFLWSLPAVIAGCVLGLALFGKVNDVSFRRIVLACLLVSGVAMIYPQVFAGVAQAAR
jgi:uncharacterized membrane protein YfcA